MNWIIEIYKNSVVVIGDNNYRSNYEVRTGWQANVDKVENIYIVSLKNTQNADNVIHLSMLPVENTTILWKNIEDVYRSFDNINTITKL